MSNNLSHDQKRKAKLAKRARKQSRDNEPTPYSGQKYQADEWVHHVFATEKAIYETIKLSNSTLTNKQVKAALVAIIEHIREGNQAILPEDAPVISFTAGTEVEYLFWNIRYHWRLLVADVGPVHKEDFVGILRTLLCSLQAHAWKTGEQRGYVAFIEDFLDRGDEDLA
ncbi:MAG TPA: hypothetical protein VG097_11120 [Gemmata sp.]|jgi:hypothetical protein|nr:hypothetical protein [Gemmata sp.]